MTLKHSKTFYKYLFSYLALLLVGVFSLCLFFESYLSLRLKDSLLENQQEILRQSSLSVDSAVQQIEAIDYQLTSVNDSFFAYFFMEDSPVRDLKIVQELKRMLAPVTFVSEIAMYNPHSGYVYTSSAAYAEEIFFSSIYHFDNWPTIQDDLASQKQRCVRPAETVNGIDRYIVFVNTPSLYSRLDQSMLLFFVKENQFTTRFSSTETNNREAAVADDDGQIIFSTLPLTYDMISGAQASVTVDGIRYLILSERSRAMDWTYYSIMPLNDVLLPLYRVRTTAYILIGVTGLMGILLICFFMKVNYKPLKELTRALGAPAKGDEIQSLGDAIHLLSTQNETMRRQLMSSPDGQALKDALLFSLLKRKFVSFEQFNREGAALDMRFDKPLYQVLMLRHFSADETYPPRAQVQAALTKTLGNGFCWYFRELFESSMLVCLVGMDEGMESQLAERCRACITVLAEEYNLIFSIGASECYRDIDHIAAACFEATQAVREHFIRGSQQFIRYTQFNQTLFSVENPLRELDCIVQQTPIQRMQTLRGFITRMKESQTPSLLARSYCNYAVQLILSCTPTGVSGSDLFSINYLRTIDDYLSFMLRLISDGMPKPQSADASGADENELLTRIMNYIGKNYDDCNFSIQDAADQLSLNSSYMSQYFHQQTGDTLSAHVAALRTQKARMLLETTAMPLQLVAESVGYYNLNSFIRRFKQVTGSTPGEYRRAYQ